MAGSMIDKGARALPSHISRLIAFLVVLGALSGSLRAQQGNITTVAGGGPTTISKPNGAVSNVASTGEVGQIAWDGTHQVFYFTSTTFHRIYRYDPSTGAATSFAGNGLNGFGGDGGDISQASFAGPIGLVLDPTNPNVFYVADTGNNRVRRINLTSNTIDTLFGSGTCNPGELTQSDVPGTSANLCAPGQMAIDGNGVLYVFDLTKSAVWRLASGQAHMIAGNGTALSSAPSSGGPATSMSLGNFGYLAVDAAGQSLYLNETFGLRQLNLTSGVLSAPLDLSGASPLLRDGSPVAMDPATGNVIYAIYPPPPPPSGGSCDPLVDPTCSIGGSPAPLTASIFSYSPTTGQKVLVAGQGTNVPPFLSATSNVNLGASNNGLGELVAIEPAGGAAAAFVASRSGWIHSMDSLSSSPNFLTILGNGSRSYCGDGGPATSACLDSPTSISAKADGSFFIADNGNGVVRFVDTRGIIHSLISPKTAGAPPTSIAAIPNGVTVFDNYNQPLPPGTVLFSSLPRRQIFALDPAADSTIVYSGTGIAPCKTLSNGTLNCNFGEGFGLLKAQYDQPLAVAVDSLGYPFVGEATGNLIFCLACPADDPIESVAGGPGGYLSSGYPAYQTQLNGLVALAVDGDNGLILAENGGQSVRRISPDLQYGTVDTAGRDSEIVSDVMTTASNGANFSPVGVAAIPGRILASDAGSARVMAAVRPGGACSAGSGPLQSNVFAGGGTDFRDNIPATQATFGRKLVETGVFNSLDSVGQLGSTTINHEIFVYIVDRANNRIRMVDSGTNHPPVANAGPDQTFHANNGSGVLVAFDGSASTDPDCDLLTYTWTGPDLAATVTGEFAQQYVLGVGKHVITLTVSDGFGGVSTATMNVTVLVPGPDLGIAVAPSAATVNAGDGLTYNVTITNNGPVDGIGVTVTLPLTPDANFLSGTAPGGPCTGPAAANYGPVVCSFGNLANGQSASGTISIQPNSAGTLTYTLSVSSDLGDPNPANDSATVSTQVNPSTGGGTGGDGTGGGGTGGGSGSCNCTLTGSYVDPAKGFDVSGNPPASPGNKFIVSSTIDNTNQFNTISVTRLSDGAVLIPEKGLPITAHWGFSPDGDRIAIHAVTPGSTEDEVWVYDLSVAPAKQVMYYQLPVVSDRLQFSPSGQYFVLTALVAQGRTEIDIYRVAGVSTEDRVFQTSFSFQSVPGVNEDEFGAVNWGFSPDQPESSFVYAYGNGQSTVSLNIANLTSPHVVPVLNGWNITGVAGFWQYNPCGNLLGVVWQPFPSQVEVDLFNTTDGTKAGSSGETFPVDFVALTSAGAAEQATVGFNAPVDIATNPSCALNTPTGSNVTVAPKDPTTGTSPVTVTFSNVTQAGQTSVTTGSTGAASPDGFKLGNPPTIYDVTTTATFAGTATICINYSGITFSGSPQLYHYANGAWAKITTTVDTVNHIVCGTTSSFSPFAVFEPTNQPPTANAGANQTVEATGPAGALVTLSGTASDPDNDPITFTWSENGLTLGTGAQTNVTLSIGMHTIILTADDGRGGTGSSTVVITVRDTIAPKITCASPDTQWHSTDVNISCSASDTGSGLANPADVAFTLSTSVAAGIETSIAQTSTRTVCDVAGNCATAGPIGPSKVDKKGPSVTLSTPANGSVYLLNQSVAVNFSCADSGSGLGSCSGTVASGGSLDTSTVGTKSFAVTGIDAVGNTTPVTNTYTVSYAPGGICNGDAGHQILQPINADGTSVWKQGRTIPAKFRVCDAKSVSVGTPGVVASFMLVQIISGTTTDVDETVGSTTADTAFRWDSSGQQWIFNISTANLPAGKTYVFRIQLNDGSSISFRFGLK